MRLLSDNFELTPENIQIALPEGTIGEACQFSHLLTPNEKKRVDLLFFYASDSEHSQMMCFGVNQGHLKMYSYGATESGVCLTHRVTRFLVWIGNQFLAKGTLPSRKDIEKLDLDEVSPSEFPRDIDTEL